MARDVLTPTNLLNGLDPGVIDYGTAHTWAPANDVEIPYSGNEIVVIKNVTGGPAVVTFQAVADSQGRSYTSMPTITVAAGDWGVVGPVQFDGWVQTGDVIHLDCDVAVEAIVFRP